jgi:hypothetical protein
MSESVGRETAKFDRTNPEHVSAMKGKSKTMTDISIGSGGQFSFIRKEAPAKKAVAKPKSNLEKAMDKEVSARKNKLIK